MEEKVVYRSPSNMCPECRTPTLVEDYDIGETVCKNCGLVITDKKIDQGPEWRAYTKEEFEQKSHTGPQETLTMHDKGLSTVIDFRNEDVWGRKLSPAASSQMGRLRKWQKRSRVMSATERNLAKANAELARLSDKLNLPSVVKELAAKIYRSAVDKGKVRGRSIITMVSAATYMACRLTGTQRTLDDFAVVSLVGRKEIARSYRVIHWDVSTQTPDGSDPCAFVSKVASKLSISEKTQMAAIELLQKAKKEKISGGKGPMGLVAAAIYIACIIEGERNKFDEKITQKNLAEIAKITEVTVRNRYKELRDKFKLDIL